MRFLSRGRRRAALLPVFIVSAFWSVARAGSVLWEYPENRDRVQDVVMLDDGSACLLFQQSGPQRLAPGESTPQPMGLEPDGRVSFLRIFRGEGDVDLLVAGLMRGTAPCLWARRGGRWERQAKIEDSPDRPFCHQGKDGTIWVHSWDGVIYRFARGEAERYDYAPRVDKSGHSYTHYQSLRAAESDDGLVAFAHHFGGKRGGKAMDHVLIRGKGDWQKLALADLHPGGMCFTAEGHLLLGTERGLVEFDPAAGAQPVRTIPPPRASVPLEIPVFLARLPDGVLVTLWGKTRSSHWGGGAPAYEDGAFSKLAEYDGEQWHTVDVVADSAAWDYYRSVRPAVVDQEGRYWLGVAGGVLCRDRAGDWKRYDWRDGLIAPTPVRLVPGKGRTLWVVDGSGSCVAVDTGTLADDRAGKTPWSDLTVRCELKTGPDGCLYGVSDHKGGSVLRIGPAGLTYNVLPADLGFRVEQLYYLSFDSAGGLWLFSNISQDKTARFDGTDWKVYKHRGKGEQLVRDKEVAFQSQLGKGARFRIGSPEDQYYVQYTDDGRILYQNEWRRACYYDGKTWYAPYGGYEVGKSRLPDHPFFHDGKVTVCVSGKCYQMENKEWAKVPRGYGERPWREVPAIPHPFSQKAAREASAVTLPGSCPLPAEERAWVFEDAGRTWVGGKGKLFCCTGGTWLPLSAERSPLASGTRVLKVLSAPDGRWLFQLNGGRPIRYAVYQAGTLDIDPGPRDLGRVDRPFTRVKIPWRTPVKNEDLFMRYRVDGGEWTGLLPVEDFELGVIAGEGRHTLRFELFGRNQLLSSPLLEYALQVAYDSETLIGDLIAALGAPSWREREQATRDLIRFGKAALPRVRQALPADDPEISERLHRILAELEKAK